MRTEIRHLLEEKAEEKYQKFSSSLIPGAQQMLGIRLPILRDIAKQLAKGDWKAEWDYKEDIYFEETMLRGMMLGYACKDYSEALKYIKEFIPRVTNWSVCDSVFMGMKILQKDREATKAFVIPYLQSGKEFSVRVQLIIMMQHLLKSDANGKTISRLRSVSMEQLESEMQLPGQYIDFVLEQCNRPFTEGYYASMAASWLIAESFCVYPYKTMEFIHKNQMDDVTYNKALQKIVESRIPTDEVKDYIRSLKRR